MRTNGPFSTYNRAIAMRPQVGHNKLYDLFHGTGRSDIGSSLLGALGAGESYLIVSLAAWSGNETVEPVKSDFLKELELDVAILRAPMVKMDGNQAMLYQHKVRQHEARIARLKENAAPANVECVEVVSERN